MSVTDSSRRSSFAALGDADSGKKKPKPEIAGPDKGGLNRGQSYRAVMKNGSVTNLGSPKRGSVSGSSSKGRSSFSARTFDEDDESEKRDDVVDEENRPQEKEQETLFDRYERYRAYLKKQREVSWLGQTYDFCLLILSVLSPLEFIYSTYILAGTDQSVTQAYVEFILACIFTFDWAFCFYLAENKYLFFTNFFAMVDLLTVIPIWVNAPFAGNVSCKYYTQVYSFADVMAYIVCGLATTRILRAFRIRRRLSFMKDEVDRLFGEIVLSFIVMVLFDASVQQYLESEVNFHPYHIWVYQTWISVTTVGYGDYYPITDLGRASQMVIVGFSLVSVPTWANELVELSNAISVYARASYVPKNKMETHIVISGELESVSLIEFFEELFHEDHDADYMHAVIMQPDTPSFEIIMMLLIPIYQLRVTYLEGSVLLDKDLKRAKAEDAAAFFIMTNKFSSKPDEEDSKTILQQFSIKRYVAQVDPSIVPFFCMQVIRPDNRKLLATSDSTSKSQGVSSRDLVICLSEIKMGVIAKAVMFPGTNTLIMNLLSSFADDGGNGDEDGEIDVEDEATANSWMAEYQAGCGWEIYSTELHKAYEGIPFAVLSEIIYQHLGVVIFAIQVEDLVKQVGRVQMVLNPADFVIPPKSECKVTAFVIAEDKTDGNLSECKHNGIKAALATLKTISSVVDNKALFYGDLKEHSVSSVLSDAAAAASRGKSRPAWQELMHRHDSKKRRDEHESFQEEMHKIHEAEMRELYYVRDKVATLEECYIETSVKDELAVINNHVIIIGKELSNLYDLVLPLRAKSAGILKYIVVLYPDMLPLSVWQKVNIFEGIFLIRGSALEEADLRRAGIFTAKQVVILGNVVAHNPSSSNGGEGEGGGNQNTSMSGKKGAASAGAEALIDADSVFCYQCVKRMNENAEIVVEIVRHANVSYLDPDSGVNATDIDYKFTPEFAAGQLFISSLLDNIVCQAFYNPDIIKVLNNIVGGYTEEFDHVLENNVVTKRKKKNQIKGSSLYQIQIPDGLDSRTYGSLFTYLSARRVIPLGLFRGVFAHTSSGPKGNRNSYVFTNPPPDTELFTCDKVFVLSQVPMHSSRVSQKKLQADYEQRQREVEYLRRLRGRRKHIQTIAHSAMELKAEMLRIDDKRFDLQGQIDELESAMNEHTALFLKAVQELKGTDSLACLTSYKRAELDNRVQQKKPPPQLLRDRREKESKDWESKFLSEHGLVNKQESDDD